MISVIICTYNRPRKVNELITLLLNQSEVPEEIIVVDSSDAPNEELKRYEKVKYLRSSHKNQPYQRYLGYLAARYDWLLFLDDDMEPVNENAIKSVKILPNEVSEVVAFAIRFENLHEDTALAQIPKTQIKKGENTFHRFIRWFTGYPVLRDGKVGWNGIRGKQPEDGFTEWFSGGAFLTRRDVIFQNFNCGLFTMFEERIGMGEDLIIAYSIAQKGKVWAINKILFYHNDQKDSSYSVDVKSYNRRVIYSRLFLSLEKARLTNHLKWTAFLSFHYYALWRGLGLLVNLTINPSKKRLNAFQGFVSGFLKSYKLLRMNIQQEQLHWSNEAQKDRS